MTPETGIVYNIHGFTDEGCISDVAIFIYYESYEERLSRHAGYFLSGRQSPAPTLLTLLAFHGREKDSCCKAEPMIETLAGIHSEIDIQLIAEGVETLFEI